MSSPDATLFAAAQHPCNRAMELLVRAKKRVVPNLRLEDLPLYPPTKKWLFGRLRQKEVLVHGFPFLLDPLDSLELSIFRRYEPFETALLSAEIQPGMTILDIGANIGYYTLLFSKLTGANGRVVAFEPEPQNFALLKENLTRNHRTNVEALNVAAGDLAGESFLYLSEENRGDHQAYPTAENRQKVRMTTARIDDCVRRPVDLVKMDVQGFEAHALAGMEATIAANPRLTIFTEFWPEGLRRAGSDGAEFLRRLRSFGLEIFFINEYANRLEPADDETLLRRYAPARGLHTNLLCRRPDSADR
ncbi:MAG TPA: FkbM family methyltransferase [Chthoniobacterales bacterium]|nr:FkbM family methyltransferase [Chthoniobacterales bacterium]